jgi:hypothetical protein
VRQLRACNPVQSRLVGGARSGSLLVGDPGEGRWNGFISSSERRRCLVEGHRPLSFARSLSKHISPPARTGPYGQADVLSELRKDPQFSLMFVDGGHRRARLVQ